MSVDAILNDPPDMAFLPPEEDRCMYYEQCENTVRGNGMMCGECLDRVRHKGRGHDAG